jgi:hypothetical protein
MFECYFCQKNSYDNIAPRDVYTCYDCAEKYDLKYVFTTLPDYAHIYTHNDYHIRLHLKLNLTYIIKKDSINGYVLQLSGFPFTPANVKKKLKLYLTFS